MVHDEQVDREALRLFASSSGCICEVEEAEDGAGAVEIAARFKPDIMFLDIRMPGMDGLEAAAAIRAFDARVRIVFLTAYGELGYARAAFKVRADDFLLKPVSEASFLDALERASLSLRESGALPCGGTAGDPARSWELERRLLHHLRSGAGEEAVTAAGQAFELAAGSGTELEEARRIARLILASIFRSLHREFGRSFGAVESVEEPLRRARTRGEVAVVVTGAVRTLAGEIREITADRRRKAVDSVVSYIDRNLTGPVSLEEASRIAGLSRCHLSRVFHTATGTTFSEYLCARRLDRAKELLADPSLPIKRICALTGFSDPAYFAAAFRKREGMSPSGYRALLKRRSAVPLLKRMDPE